MRLTALTLVALLVMTCGPISALNWQFHDFGNSPFDVVPSSSTGSNNDWAPIDYPKIGHFPSPGDV